jgi:peptidoglycan-associated lipoprotein
VDIDAVIRDAFQTIYFDYDKADLREESKYTLGRAANAMRSHSSIRVMAEGHADERGTSTYNMGLGENRAKAVREFLTAYGIEADRVEVTSYGKERPANPNCGDNYSANDDCHSKNRRVEWRITGR